MKDLGDKIASTLVAQSANVSCVPWNGMDVKVFFNFVVLTIKVNYAENGIPEDVYAKATISSLEEAQECLKRIGFPAMIKASEGGGGKGWRPIYSQLLKEFEK
jgi:acetyl-CoA carboxylase/biotin carboxylase 1